MPVCGVTFRSPPGTLMMLRTTDFLAGKEAMWSGHGYGPWAFYMDDRYAGWGGLQPDDGEAELALVLCPWAFGYGRLIAAKVIDWGFRELGVDRILVYLPASRSVERFLSNGGFRRDGHISIHEITFSRFILMRSQ